MGHDLYENPLGTDGFKFVEFAAPEPRELARLFEATGFTAVARQRACGMNFQDTPDSYYEAVDRSVPGHGESLDQLRKRRIPIDGAPTQGQGLLLEIFTQNLPCFFEIIQRKGNEAPGKGNFTALSETLELNEMRRGALSARVALRKSS